MKRAAAVFLALALLLAPAVAGAGKKTQKAIVPKPRITITMERRDIRGQLKSMILLTDTIAWYEVPTSITMWDARKFSHDALLLQYRYPKVKRLILDISSYGGGVFAGLGMTDTILKLRRHGMVVEGRVSGLVASAATSILVVCSERVATPYTSFMVHRAAAGVWLKEFNLESSEAQTRLFRFLRKRYLGLMTKYTRSSYAEWESRIKATTWFSAQDALKWGLIDRIDTPKPLPHKHRIAPEE